MPYCTGLTADKRDAGVALLCTQAKRGTTVENGKIVVTGSLQVGFADTCVECDLKMYYGTRHKFCEWIQ